MSLFLSATEHTRFNAFRKKQAIGQDLFWALGNRAAARAAEPGLHGPEAESNWWFLAAEYLTDAAMAHALKPAEPIGIWIRDVTLSLVRRPETDWVGPLFRSHGKEKPEGHLETAHLTWGVAVALDLVPGVFTAGELEEIRGILKERGMVLCRRWLENHHHLANWRCVLGAGFAVAAAVLEDADALEMALGDYQMSVNVFQPDGSYGESLQYGNYAAYTLTLAREALLRARPDWESQLPLRPWGLLPRWQAASHFYRKPLSGWGSGRLPRAANFNDSAAVFRPSADLLLHIAARERDSESMSAGLARWLFDTLYAPDLTQGPHDAATFGFFNDFGFLSVPLLPVAAEAQTPKNAGLGAVEAFGCGDVIARDVWNGRTILATRGGGDRLHGPGHLHGDLNSFILTHNDERLLVDPGHSCYRNLIHGLEGATRTHNTCTFVVREEDDLGLQEDKDTRCLLEQSRRARSTFDPVTREIHPFPDRGGRRLIAAEDGPLRVIGSEAGALYGPVIQRFARYWILCGSHALFIVDHILAQEPVKTSWHWLLNNRDGKLECKIIHPDRMVARRPGAGLKLFHIGDGVPGTPGHAFVHDAYHPQPNQIGEGASGSGSLVTWTSRGAARECLGVHALAIDGYGPVSSWHLREIDGHPALESPGATVCWRLAIEPDFDSLRISETVSGLEWIIENEVRQEKLEGATLRSGPPK